MSDIYQRNKKAELKVKADEIIKQLPECSKLYFREMRTSNKSERTIYEYALDIKAFFDYLSLQPSFKDVDFNLLNISQILDKLTREDLQEYIETFSEREISDHTGKTIKVASSPAYIARKKSSLKSFYQYYYDLKLIEDNTASSIKSSSIKDKNILILENDEIDRFIQATEPSKNTASKQILASRDKTIISLFLMSGIRVSELVGIDLSDIDFKRAAIRIVRKGGNEDEIYLSEKLEKTLSDYIENSRKELLKGIDSPALFIGQNKERMSVRSIEKLIQKYALKAGLNKKITPHALRRTCGSYLYNETGDIYEVARLLGHKSIETTKKHYAKPNEEKKRNASKVLNDII